MKRIMIAGTASGCGKTTIVCALLQAFVNRHLKVMSYKCGPDYIDPMFHSEIIGVPSRNLDGFFMDRQTVCSLVRKNSRGMDLSVMEGVMGFYDGLGMTDTASSFALARDTKTPVVLVVNCRGMSRSVEAVIRGYTGFQPESGIAGVIFNQLPARLYPAMQTFCRTEGLRALGYFPKIEEAQIGSRHLGLITAEEIGNLKEIMQKLAGAAEQYLDLDGILEIAGCAGELAAASDIGTAVCPVQGKVRLAAARDRAFCFYYEDNFDLLRACGAEIIPFSPLADGHLPEDIDGLYLGGGYPELYARQLEENVSMREAIRRAAGAGMPVYAECGGFLYLHKTLRTPDGKTYRMAGVLEGSCRFTDHLQHFGYVTLTAKTDSILCRRGETIRAHEFHRYRSDLPCSAFMAVKGEDRWMSGCSQGNILGGFAHMHFYANQTFARHLIMTCAQYRDRKNGNRENQSGAD